jgi:hypothetical protein
MHKYEAEIRSRPSRRSRSNLAARRRKAALDRPRRRRPQFLIAVTEHGLCRPGISHPSPRRRHGILSFVPRHGRPVAARQPYDSGAAELPKEHCGDRPAGADLFAERR